MTEWSPTFHTHAELIYVAEGSVPITVHAGTGTSARGDVGRYCILPGDPGRRKKIAAYFDGAVHVTTNREYVTCTGTLP